MFVPFFYTLRKRGVMVTPTAFLRLQKALSLRLVVSLDDFYIVARSILVKSERDFDTYDQVFAELFAGVETVPLEGLELDEAARQLLKTWVKTPQDLAKALGLTEKELRRLTAEELEQYLLDRLKDQKAVHYGGRKWIGAGGVSPVGHSGNRPGGMRIGGGSRARSASKVALERRYRDYSRTAPLTRSQMGEALQRLRHLKPVGPMDELNLDKTITETMRNAGEIEIVFDRRMVDRLKVLLLIDNGGWSMDPYVETVQALFHHARSQFKELSIRYFHNTIRDRVWCDAERRHKPEPVEDLLRRDPETRLIFVGDASMAPEELLDINGSIEIEFRQKKPSIENLKMLAGAFRHAAWFNPSSSSLWSYGETISIIRDIIPMFELNLDGLEKGVRHLSAR
ncbi:hypothetical protein A7E78_02875 [Syntrophotalea acetylenivorans]|uniref:VWA containing CoxE family protein n=1 Tax=Syntrophotalea acetylenivorans TaxID=1842532 RepID=A0A1L3GLQ7_9BACT|nr:hypothetical protein A7E78_02875 [Syntrophotalea acetylenivorans]